MNLVDRLKARWAERQIEKQATKLLETNEFVPFGSIAHIYAHPERYNRASRRRVGYRQPVGLMTEQMVGITVQDDPAGIVPRYVRRHLKNLGPNPKGRRARKQRTRMVRALNARGMMP